MTEKVQLGCPHSLDDNIRKRMEIREMSAEDFIERHGSGTLRKNKRLGMAWRSQYLDERVAFEFGYGFEALPSSRVLYGVPFTEGDCHPVTEAGWHADRYIVMSLFPEDVFSAKYLNVEYNNGIRKEGIGILCEKTSAPFIPGGHTVFSIIAEYNKQRGEYNEAQNPF